MMWPAAIAAGATRPAARPAVPLALAEPLFVFHALIRVEDGLGRFDRLLKIRAHLALQRLGLVVVVLIGLIEARLLLRGQQRLDSLVALAAELAAAVFVLLAAAIGRLRPDLLELLFLLRTKVQQRVELALAAGAGRLSR